MSFELKRELEPELKRCPFCGGEASIKLNGKFYWIVCSKCLAEVGGSYSGTEAIKQWNRRTNDEVTN